MASEPPLTAEQFALLDPDEDPELRWSELVAGELVHLSQPDALHGTIVLNFSRALAGHLQARPDEPAYAAYEIGLIVDRNPDSVRRPAISVFNTGPRFAELGRTVTETRPALVIEIASSNDRRRSLSDRVQAYLGLGVPLIWAIDPVEKSVGTYGPGRLPVTSRGDDQLRGDPSLPDFTLRVADLFVEPF